MTDQVDDNIRVMLADDSDSLRRVMKAVLRMEPAIQLVGEACDFQQLLVMMVKVPADVIVMDVHMPDAKSNLSP
jgi:two-component system chemotaxis response regulator CheB